MNIEIYRKAGFSRWNIAASFAVLSGLGSSTLGAMYDITSLGAGAGIALNLNGEIVGRTDSSVPMFNNGAGTVPVTRFQYRSNTLTTASDGTALAVNSAGVAVGSATPTGQLSSYGFTLQTTAATPTLQQLPDFGGGVTVATAINTAGTVVGFSQYAGRNGFAFSWSPGDAALHPLDPGAGNATGLGYTGTGGSSSAAGINATGAIVGQATNTASESHAFLTAGATLFDLGTTGGGSSSGAEAINDSGEIVGFALDGAGNSQAFSYTGYNTAAITPSADTPLNGHFTPLDPAAVFLSSDAHALNAAGLIVGDAIDSNGDQVAFLYQPGVGITDLTSLIDPATGWTLQYASGINAAGQITGYGGIDGGPQTAFLLTPSSIPEPASLGVVGSGTALLACRRRISKQREFQKWFREGTPKSSAEELRS